MENPSSLVDEMRFLILARKIKVIGFAIIIGLMVIYGAGMFVASNNVNKDMAMLNLISVIAAPVLCIASVYLRKSRMKGITNENFKERFPGVYILAFAMCDLGGLFCITTNLFVNYNFIYATFGLLVSILYIWINFPKANDLEMINNKSKSVPE